MDETLGLRIMWVLLATLGVQIDAVQDNNTINFSVPSISDYSISDYTAAVPIEGVKQGEMIAGELLLELAGQFFRENGFIPNGRIRSEYWMKQMGEFAQMKIQAEMDE